MMPSLSKVLAAAAAAAFILPTAPASASTAMRFSVRPDPSGSLSPGADYFVMDAAPGDVVTDALEVSNPGGRPVAVRLAAVDATTAAFGGVDYSPSESRPRAVGGWIELEETTLELAPGEVETVRFTVSVPADARTGVNLGGIAAWTPPRGAGSSEKEGLAATTEVQTRRVVAVQVELPGPADPVIEIDEVTAAARPDGVYLEVDLRNTGHGFAEGEGVLELPDEGFSSTFPLDKVVPGTGVGYPVRWRTQSPPPGTYPVAVEIDYGTGVAEYRGEVVVGSALRADLEDRGIGGGGRGGFPVLLLPVAAGLALCCAAAALLWRRRRIGRAKATPSAPPAVPSTAAAVQAPPPPPPIAVRPAGTPPPPPPPPGGPAPRQPTRLVKQ